MTARRAFGERAGEIEHYPVLWHGATLREMQHRTIGESRPKITVSEPSVIALQRLVGGDRIALREQDHEYQRCDRQSAEEPARELVAACSNRFY